MVMDHITIIIAIMFTPMSMEALFSSGPIFIIIIMSLIQVVQVYISWSNTDIAPMRQLVGAKRVSLLSPSKSADVSYLY